MFLDHRKQEVLLTQIGIAKMFEIFLSLVGYSNKNSATNKLNSIFLQYSYYICLVLEFNKHGLGQMNDC